MDIYNNHKRLFGAALILFIGLTMFAAVLPALDSQNNNAPLPESKPLTNKEITGKGIFIREGCIACHTQQVRNIDMDKMWGTRPSIAADYARNIRTDFWRNTANLMGSERTGPDLMNIGNRQPSEDWQLLHLFNPRSVVSQSIMPAYPWLFKVKEYAFPDDVVVNVPDEFRHGVTGKIIASEDALALVAYLKSFKQLKLPDGKPNPLFLYGKEIKPALPGTTSKLNTELDGAALYAANCQSCHQENGEGLKGAFPALKGSSIVLDNDPTVLLTVIMKGYNGRVNEGFGVMPAVGTNNNLSPEEIAAIMNHERTSWGNNASKVTLTQVKELFNQVKSGPIAK